MKPEEAIEILSDSANAGMTTFDEKYKKAQKLGVEALKHILFIRKYAKPSRWVILPGETV